MQQKGLTAFPLKIIAVAAMLINHIGCGPFGFEETNFPLYMLCFVVGKLTFPIMAFLVVEGYKYTRNFTRYAMRLGAFWLLSIVPFWLAFHGRQPFGIAQLTNNVMFTLLMGLLSLYITDRVSHPTLRYLVVVLLSLATIGSDWSIVGVLIVYGFYRTSGPKRRIIVPVVCYGMLPFMVILLLGAWGYTMMGDPISAWQAAGMSLGFLGMLLPIPLLLRYNGQRGYNPAWVKWGFYAFYPIHLLIIGLIARFL